MKNCKEIFLVPYVLSGERLVRKICMKTSHRCNPLKCPKLKEQIEQKQPKLQCVEE